MKKIIILFLVLLASMFLFSSCGCNHSEFSEADCTTPKQCLDCNEILGPSLGHTAGEWITDKEATCTEDGSKHQVCSVCNTNIKTEVLTKLGHKDGEWITDREATCTEDGSKHQVCSVCNATVKTEIVTKLGHTEVIDPAVAPNCIKTGLTEGSHCSKCNIVLKKQTTVNKTNTHTGNEGICTVCKTVTNAELALSTYIRKNGSKLNSGNRYVIYQNINTEVTTYIEYDFDKKKFVFSMSSDSDSDVFITLTLDRGNTQQLVQMTVTMDGTQFYAEGNIYTQTFSTQNKYIYNFECNYSLLASSLKDLLGSVTASLLTSSELVLMETNTGVTMSMLGFKSIT